MTTKNIQDVVAEKVEEFERLFRVATPYRTTKEQKQADWLTTTLTQLIKEVEAGEHKRCVDLLDRDHSNCPIKETCIGYQNAQSDLINTPPTSDVTENKTP